MYGYRYSISVSSSDLPPPPVFTLEDQISQGSIAEPRGRSRLEFEEISRRSYQEESGGAKTGLHVGDVLQTDGRRRGDVVSGKISEKLFIVDDRNPQEEEAVNLGFAVTQVEKQQRPGSTREGVDVDLNACFPIAESRAIVGDLSVHTERFAEEFERMVMKAAREIHVLPANSAISSESANLMASLDSLMSPESPKRGSVNCIILYLPRT